VTPCDLLIRNRTPPNVVIQLPDCTVSHQEPVIVKGKAIPLHAWRVPEDSSKLRLPDVKTIGIYEGGKVVSPTLRPLLPPGSIPGTHFC